MVNIKYFATKTAAQRFAKGFPGGTAYTIEPSIGGEWIVEWDHQIIRGRLV